MIKKLFLISLIFSTLFSYTFEEVRNFEKSNGTIKALSFYKELAEQNNTKAMMHLAKIYLEGKEIEKSFSKAKELLERASKLNDNKASFYLGRFYLSKKTPYFNPAKAYNSFVKAANNDYAPAQNMVGEFLVNGIAVDKDYKLAVKLFEKASKQGFIDAQCNLAFMYASGKGVFPNFGRAHQFAKKGKELGNKRCIKVWNDYKLEKYPEDKGWKFNFYTKP
jgi:TPR repeat protein